MRNHPKYLGTTARYHIKTLRYGLITPSGIYIDRYSNKILRK